MTTTADNVTIWQCDNGKQQQLGDMALRRFRTMVVASSGAGCHGPVDAALSPRIRAVLQAADCGVILVQTLTAGCHARRPRLFAGDGHAGPRLGTALQEAGELET
jgi:hypothetical protein